MITTDNNDDYDGSSRYGGPGTCPGLCFAEIISSHPPNDPLRSGLLFLLSSSGHRPREGI